MTSEEMERTIEFLLDYREINTESDNVFKIQNNYI